MKLKRIMTIAGSDSGGGAGIQADLKTITALGGFGMSVITALTAQNTLGVHGIHEIPVEFVEKQFDAVATDIGIDAAKTGMLSNASVIKAVAGKIRHYAVKNLVVDPVMVAKGGTRLIKDEAKETLIRELLPLALIVTPNIPEAEELTGMRITSIADMQKAAIAIRDMGAATVLVKGGHMGGAAVDVLCDSGTFDEFRSERIDTTDTHGTGCTMSAAIATGIAQGMPVQEAVRQAKDYVTTAIRFSLRIGGGHGPTNHGAYCVRERERYRCIESLKDAVKQLKQSGCGNVIPEIQSNFVYALPYAAGKDDVAGIPGRIIRVGEDAETLHDPSFGVSRHVAGIVLTVMSYDDAYRSAMDIMFSDELVGICRDLGYDVAEFSRQDEPDEVRKREGSSLSWGVRQVLEAKASIPDMIFDRGGVGKEPVIRILGRDPAAVARMVLELSRRLRERQ
jgi:hydroxymethylpyrimidine/phosphomethylpyrimidine kinase